MEKPDSMTKFDMCQKNPQKIVLYEKTGKQTFLETIDFYMTFEAFSKGSVLVIKSYMTGKFASGEAVVID